MFSRLSSVLWCPIKAGKFPFFAVVASLLAGVAGVSSALAQETTQTVVTNDQPKRTTQLTVGDGGKLVNPKGFEIRVTGVTAIKTGNNTPQFQVIVINDGPIFAKNGRGIDVGSGGQDKWGGRIINRGPIESTGTGARGISVRGSTAPYQSVVENYAPILVDTSSGFGLGIRGGPGVRVINRGPIKTTGPNGWGITVGNSGINIEYQSVVENYADITTTGSGGRGISTGIGARVLNYGNIKTSGDSATGILGGRTYEKEFRSWVENYGDITTEGTNAHAISVGTNSRVINWGALRTAGDGAYGVLIGESFEHYQSVIENYGSIITTGGDAEPDASHGIIGIGPGIWVINRGTIKTNGVNARGVKIGNSRAPYQSIIENYGSIATRGGRKDYVPNRGGAHGIEVGTGGRVLNRGMVATQGDESRGIFVGASTADYQSVIENFGSVTTQGRDADAIIVGTGARVLNRGMVATQGAQSHGIFVGASTTQYQSVIENFGSIATSGDDAHAIVAGAGSQVLNRGSLVSRQGKAINFTGGGNRLTLGSESYIVGNIDLGTGTRVALDLSRGGSGLWQLEGTLTGDITATGESGATAWAYDAAQGLLAVFDSTVLSSGQDTLAISSSGVSDLVGGRLDRLAGVAGGGGQSLSGCISGRRHAHRSRCHGGGMV